MPDRPISPQSRPEEVVVDAALRPRTLAEMVGQDRLRENLRSSSRPRVRAARRWITCCLYGPPGLGKTTLAHILSSEMGVGLKVTAGPAIERAGDLAAILTNLRQGDILFIDEVHRLGRAVEEVLYPAMEDYALDIVIGKGPSARNIRLKLPRFTLIGATTRLALMTAPLRARFGAVYRFDFYEVEAVQKIVRRAAGPAPGAHHARRRGRDRPPRPRHAARGAAPAAPRARLRPGARRRHHHRPDGPARRWRCWTWTSWAWTRWTAPCWAASSATSAAARWGWRRSPRRCRRNRTPSWMWSSRTCSSSASSTAPARPDGDAQGLRAPGRAVPRNRRAARIV